MHIEKLKLQHYRNYAKLELDFENGVHIFCGQNAQGKTNVIESIYVLAMAKSHRTHRDKELISWDSSFATIQGRIARKYGSIMMEIQLSNLGKKAKINGNEQRKLSEYIGGLNVVMFAPEDLNLVKGTPGHRRRFIDMEIGQVSPHYLYNLSQYNKILIQRNNLLKELSKQRIRHSDMLDVWNDQLTDTAIKLMLKRLQFIGKLQKWAEQIHAIITENKEALVIKYRDSFGLQGNAYDERQMTELFRNKLEKVSNQEIDRGTTLVGPHRDDLDFFINGIDVQSFGSQGQQRTTALSLKLAEIELIHDEVGEYPVLLLDDVLSELDRSRQTQLLEAIQNKVQTFITTTSIDSIAPDTLSNAFIYGVEDGVIRSVNRGEV